MNEFKKAWVSWTEEEKKSVIEDYSNYLKFRESGVSREEVVQKQKELEEKYQRNFPSVVATASRELRKQKRERR